MCNVGEELPPQLRVMQHKKIHISGRADEVYNRLKNMAAQFRKR